MQKRNGEMVGFCCLEVNINYIFEMSSLQDFISVVSVTFILPQPPLIPVEQCVRL